ncbi:MAG: alpha-glucosidase [Candidatus Izimaplasma sp.]|nr:alpha-glucosidase [Candidatus Izimaplasma bacterium]
MQTKWWHNKVVYQIYPKSFNDTTGDGIGDIKGIIEKLEYLCFLGIDIIWLSPVYESPMKDNGYDIANYQKIDPSFGTMADMEQLIYEAKKHDISIVMDLVINHTSDQHPWFIKAKKNKRNKYRDYYIWRDEATDIGSVFGGSAWEFDETTDQYYFHLFTKEQPDLNWQNKKMRHDMYDMINWWFDKGIRGFRLDVIDLIGKDIDNNITANGPRLHPLIKEMSNATFQKHDAFTVGETWGASVDEAALYSNPSQQELSMIFQFEHITLNWHPEFNKFKTTPLNRLALKNILYKWQTEIHPNAWNSLFFNNHDLGRVTSRWGNDGIYNEQCAKAFATVLHMMKGTPFVYQGEEIAMTNVKYQHIDDYNDIEIHNRYHEYVIERQVMGQKEFMQQVYLNGRDNARTPMQWDKSINGGFSIGSPWLRPNSNYLFINVDDNLKQKNSVFYHYQKLIQLRKSDNYGNTLTYGSFIPKTTEYDNLFLFERHYEEKRIIVAVNLGEQSVSFNWENSIDEILINTGQIDYFKTVTLNAYDALVFAY